MAGSGAVGGAVAHARIRDRSRAREFSRATKNRPREQMTSLKNSRKIADISENLRERSGRMRTVSERGKFPRKIDAG